MLNGRDKVEGGINEHWLDRAIRNGERIIYDGNKVRMTADVIVWLQQWKNDMLGVKRSIAEESLIYEEKNEQMV